MTDQSTSPPPAPPPDLEVDFVKQFMLLRQGRWFVTYPGLLYLAHRKGLVGISVSILQYPDDSNGKTCVCYAEVKLEQNEQTKVFGDIGDASPANVSKAILPHILRMASTRAKARALRDAVNIGYTTLEELTEGGESQSTQQNGASRPAQNGQQNGQQNGRTQPRSTPSPNDDIPADYGEWPYADHQFDAQTSGGDQLADDQPEVVEVRPGEFTVKYKGETWAVTEAVMKLETAERNAYLSWVRQIHDAQTTHEMSDVWKVVDPAAKRLGDDVYKVVYEMGRKKTARLREAGKKAR